MFKIIGVFLLLLAFVPPFRKFMFWLVIGRQVMKQQKAYEKQNQPRPDGDIRVESNVKSNKDTKDQGGQYIDYEEVK